MLTILHRHTLLVIAALTTEACSLRDLDQYEVQALAPQQCTPGTQRCQDNSPQVCDASGLWQDAAAVQQVRAGGKHTCALKKDGTLWCWGFNSNGQVGIGTTDDVLSPVQVTISENKPATAIALGEDFTCARLSDGTPWCWGVGSEGQIGNGNWCPSGGYCNTHETRPAQVKGLGTETTHLATGFFHVCARKINGTVWCWGGNDAGQVGNSKTEEGVPFPVQVAGLDSSTTNVLAGRNHSCALTKDARLWCWGANADGQLGLSTTSTTQLSPVEVAVLRNEVSEASLGWGYSCALKKDKTLWCWGASTGGKLGLHTDASKTSSPQQLTELGNSVTAVSAGTSHACARLDTGSLWCWGTSLYGEVGNGVTVESVPLPQEVKELGTSVAQVSCGASHTCALSSNGALWCWGSNSNGQLGDGTKGNNRLSPAKVRLGTCQ